MLKFYLANADKAAVGLECLPGVKQLLQELKVNPSICIVSISIHAVTFYDNHLVFSFVGS